MGLFRNTKLETEPGKMFPALELEPEEPAVNYNTVTDYLIALSDKDYKKINEVAVIYREANAKVGKVLGIKNEPTTSIKEELQPPAASDDEDADISDFLEDDLSAAFLDDQPVVPVRKSNAKKVEVKSDAAS